MRLAVLIGKKNGKFEVVNDPSEQVDDVKQSFKDAVLKNGFVGKSQYEELHLLDSARGRTKRKKFEIAPISKVKRTAE